MQEADFYQTDTTGVPMPKGGRLYLQERQIREYQDEIRNLESTLADPRSRLEDRGEVVKQLSRVKRDLEVQSPPQLTAEQRDRASKEAASLLEEIRGEMLSQEELRKCPSGAIGQEIKYLQRNKGKILRWKNLMRMLHAGDNDPDVSNLEKYRPTVNRLNMDDALIPGKTFVGTHPTPAYEEGWERTFGDPELADRLARERQELLERIARLEAQVEKSVDRRKKNKPQKEQTRCGEMIYPMHRERHRKKCAVCAEEAAA